MQRELTFKMFYSLDKIIQFTFSVLSNKLKYIDLKNEKVECENHKVVIEKILEQLHYYSDIQDLVAIDARFNPIIPIKPLPKPPQPIFPSSYVDPLIKPSQVYQLKQKQDSGMFNHNLKITDQPWFHGTLPRTDVQTNLLIVDGDFLVRVFHLNSLIISLHDNICIKLRNQQTD
jgi:hypothetical protein